MQDFFIDRLFIQQDYPEGNLPLVGRHVVQRIDLETGEPLPPSVDQKILEGSFSTKLTVRCDGNRVRVEGNPSRWQRMDNLFGLTSIDDCIAVYNHVLTSLGLPVFTKNTKLFHRQSPDGKSSSLIGNGAEITSIDWTCNLAVGQGREQSFIRGMSSMQIGRGRKPKLYPDGHTCNWGEGSEWLVSKMYNKAVELRRHLLKDSRKKEQIPEDRFNYINKLIDYCAQRGVVRLEHSLRQKQLKRYNLQFYGIVTEEDFLPHIQDFENAMQTVSVNHDEHVSIAHQLLNANVVKTMRQANTTMNYAQLWMNGIDLRDTLSRSQFFEHKARLKAIGIDIGQQFDVSRLCPTLRRSQVIDVQPLSIPSWYTLPAAANTNTLPFRAYAS